MVSACHNPRRTGLFVLFLCLLNSPAYGVEFAVNGFGSVIAGKTVSSDRLTGGDQSTYLVAPTFGKHDDGSVNDDARYDDAWSLNPDTVFGLQLHAGLKDKLSATVQATAHGANDLDPEIEWAYLTYDLRPELSFKAGKQRMPLYYYSDYLDVGYAYHWLRPPVDVYGEGISAYTGLSLDYGTLFNDWQIGVQGWLGRGENDNAFNWRARLDNAGGLIATASRDWLSLRFSRHWGEAYGGYDGLVTVPATTLSESNPIDIVFSEVAVHADFDKYFFIAEYTRLDTSPYIETVSFLANGTAIVSRADDRAALMFSAGYRFSDSVTVYGGYSENASSLSIPVIGLNTYSDTKRETWNTGVRWDVHENIALKAQLDFSTDESDAAIRTALGNTLENTTLAVGIDFVF